jgi:hypothetical protein
VEQVAVVMAEVVQQTRHPAQMVLAVAVAAVVVVVVLELSLLSFDKYFYFRGD